MATIDGYTYCTGNGDKYSDLMLTVGDRAYVISANRVDFFFYFIHKNVVILPREKNLILKVDEHEIEVDVIDIGDGVGHEYADITISESNRLSKLIYESSPLLRAKYVV